MSNWLANHWYNFLLVFRRLLRTPFSSLLTISVIGITLSLPAGLFALLQNMSTVVANIQGEPQISVFLSLTASSADVKQIETQLKQNQDIQSYEFISRDQALLEMKQTPGMDPIITSLDRNPLPDAFIIHLKVTAPDALAQLDEKLSQIPNVAHTQLDSAWAKRLFTFMRLGQQVILILAALLGIALIAITGNTIRLQILTQREEIEVSKLIGAADAFIRRPFLYHGALQGLAGGGAALAIVSISFSLLNTNVTELAQLYSSDFQLHMLPIKESMFILLLSTLLGWFGAYIAVWRYLRHIEPS